MAGDKDKRSRGQGRGGQGQSRDVQISKALSLLLRHAAEKEGLKMNGQGYANVADVVCPPVFWLAGLLYLLVTNISPYTATMAKAEIHKMYLRRDQACRRFLRQKALCSTPYPLLATYRIYNQGDYSSRVGFRRGRRVGWQYCCPGNTRHERRTNRYNTAGTFRDG